MRWGVNLPIAGVPLGASAELVRTLPAVGYRDVWTGEGSGFDGLTPLAAAAAWAPSLGLGTAVVPVSTRGPGVLAQSALTLAELTAGEVLFGIGSSVPAHVTRLNGVPFDRPLTRVRDAARFLRATLRGDDPPGDLTTIATEPYRLPVLPARPPKVLVGALRPQMLQLSYDDADGAIVNVLLPDDLDAVTAAIGDRRRPGDELIVKVFICPTTDAAAARSVGRRFLGWITNQPPYVAFHDWLGRGDELAVSRARYAGGDVGGAGAAIPDHLVDALWLHGDADALRDGIRRYVRPDVTGIVLHVSSPTADPLPTAALVETLATIAA